MEYGDVHAELYDLVFRSRGKSFEAEADDLANLIRDRFPGSASLLDVASGTGAHLARFATHFDLVVGVEWSPAMVRVASERLPGVAVHEGDMRTFDLGRTFDAVTCMGNAVACMLSSADLDTAVARMAAHLVPGGVLVVEPWWFPDNFIDGHVGGHLLREDNRVIARITRSTREGLTTRMEIKFVIAESSGIQEFTDVLITSLFTPEEYEAAFERADCTVEFVPGMKLADGRLNAPGLFIGVRK
jgi:SAM-dependent methyltransferase